MSRQSPRVVFAAEDETSYQILKRVADVLTREADIEFLFLDRFINAADDDRNVKINKETIPFDYRDVDPYLRTKYFDSIPQSLQKATLQRLALDTLTYRHAYDVQGFLRETKPDLVVSAIDQCPFLRHLIAEAHEQSVKTATLQHGIYEYALDPQQVSSRPFFPNVNRSVGMYERIKRRTGFRYGITEYAHPYTDVVMTLGDYFTRQIAFFRETYPCFGKTALKTTGSPEFQGQIQDYDGTVDSVLFLSQQQLEGGVWEWSEQRRLVDCLRSLDDLIDVSIRPHPKDSPEKVQHYQNELDVDEVASLGESIQCYDAVLTVNSTAIFEGVIQGKACGVLQLPWYEVDFKPFTDKHIIQVKAENPEICRPARSRSRQTQQDYLDQFCYMPGEDETTDKNDSVDAIISYLYSLLNNDGSISTSNFIRFG